MQHKPLVSVITPYFNDELYFPATLESFFAQTYENIEMILVDDCSSIPPDKFIPSNPKYPVHVIRTKKNSGPGHARNIAVAAAKGELIAFLDSDDLWFPEKTSKQVEYFMNSPNTTWVYTDAQYIKYDTIINKSHSRFYGFKNGMPQGKELNDFHLRGYNFLTFSSNMMKKSIFEEIGGFNEELKVSEDWDLFARLGQKYNPRVINEVLQYYRLKPNAGRHLDGHSHYIDVNKQILKQLYERQGLLPDKESDLRKGFAVIYERAAIQLLNDGYNEQARKLLFHPDAKAKYYTPRLVALQILSFVPSVFYHLALSLYTLNFQMFRNYIKYRKTESA